jgi:hypothetical protein
MLALQNRQVYAAGKNYLLTGRPLMGDPMALLTPPPSAPPPSAAPYCILYSERVQLHSL